MKQTNKQTEERRWQRNRIIALKDTIRKLEKELKNFKKELENELTLG